MENDTEVIRQQMADTRQALSAKVEAVESLVASAVKETTESVTQTVENVTQTVENVTHAVEDTVSNTAAVLSNTVESTVNTVSDSVQSVKKALDVTAYVEQYPWLVMGGSVAVGYALGSMLPSTGSNGHTAKLGDMGSSFRDAATTTTATRAASPAPARAEEHTESSFLSFLSSPTWKPVIDRLRGLAVGSAAGLVTEMVMDLVPASMKQEVSRALDETTQALGGTIIRRDNNSSGGGFTR